MAVFRIPIRLIRERFGGDNFDDAGDAIADWLGEAAGDGRAYRIAYSFDSAHANPWFHAMAVEIDGLADAAAQRLRRRLAQEGLGDRTG